jgi:hypothetical protein
VYQGPTVFAQVMANAPHRAFQRCVDRYKGNERIRRLSYWDQFLVLVFAQLTYRESLRDIEVCLWAMPQRLYHMGLRCGAVARSTLADANERRDWRVFADFAQLLIHEARLLYADEPLPVEIDTTVYAFDSTTIDLCLTLFPWAPFRATKAAIRLHTLLDLRGNIPTFIHITDGLVHDVNVLDLLIPEAGAVYVLDRGYLDFARLYSFEQASATFVTRAKKNSRFRRLYSRAVDRSSGLFCDQTVLLTGYQARNDYPAKLRRIRYHDPESGKALTFFTNNFVLAALTITELYRCRCQVELFFKWIKQHLRIKSFYGTSENAVRTQVWTAVCAYVLVAILRKRLQVEHLSLYTLLQIVSVTAFEQVPIPQLLTRDGYTPDSGDIRNQLQLFDL